MDTEPSLSASNAPMATSSMRHSSKRSLLGVSDAKFCDNILSLANLGVDATPTFHDSKTAANEKHSPSERLQRSRERNRVHARKTRQRKKEQMQTLQSRADELKQEQIRLKQYINEKNTASILVGLFATSSEKEVVSQQAEDPQVETLLKRPVEEIPDATKITELPALILPGQHNSRRGKVTGESVKDDLPDDGIDYQLLGKDRSKCTPEELDKIRRERNRMHAKRTRDRKRLFMEEMSVLCENLASENEILRGHLRKLGGECPPGPTRVESEPNEEAEDHGENPQVTMGQLMTLIEVAGSFEKNKANSMKGIMSLSSVACSVASAVSDSDSNNSSASASVTEEKEEEPMPPLKRQRLSTETRVSLGVLKSITAL